jgi:hypothetical protein
MLDEETARSGEIPDPTTLVVPLGRSLAAGREVTASMPWRLELPGPSNDRLAREGDALRLGSFFPILAWEPGVGWATEPPTKGFAEATTSPTADFDVNVAGAGELGVLATGAEVSPGHWRAVAVRDWAMSVGRFRMATESVEGVQLSVGVDAGVRDDPLHYLRTARRALVDLGRRYGPYPWPTLSLAVTPGLGGGIEYPAHVMLGPGTDDRTTPHELAHQWFYGLVGNDQGRDPWLDEGLASWAEGRYLDEVDRFTRRSIPAAAAGRLGEPMAYWDAHLPSYYRGVYVQGAQALAALGDHDRVDCALRLYVAANAHRIASPDDLLAAATSVFPDARAIFSRFGARFR